VSAWQALFRQRRDWALALAENAAHMAEAVEERYIELDTMLRCLEVAVVNVQLAIKTVEPRYDELKNWIDPTLTANRLLADKVDQYLALARSVPISHEMASFMTDASVSQRQRRQQQQQQQQHATLESLLNPETTARAVRSAPSALQYLAARANDLEVAHNKMTTGLDDVVRHLERVVDQSAVSHADDVQTLRVDLEAVAKKMDADYTTSLASSSANDVPQLSRTAEIHTSRLIPSLRKCVKEMDAMLRHATQARNAVAAHSIDLMQKIADITSLQSFVKTQIATLGSSSNDDLSTFDYLRLIQHVPYLYASYVAEAIRRREWTDKIRTDSSTLTNEMAAFQEEEAKRRKKWQRMVGSVYGPGAGAGNVIEGGGGVVGLEVSVLGQERPWPEMTKDDLDAYADSLRQRGADASILEDVQKLIADLSSPTRKQLKRIKAC